MRKIFLFVIIICGIAILISVLSDPVKQKRILSTIESSTGVNLDSIPEDTIKGTLGKKTWEALKDLGDILTNPKLLRSLEKWGKDALDRLDEGQLEELKRDLEESRGEDDFDAILEHHLGKAGDS